MGNNPFANIVDNTINVREVLPILWGEVGNNPEGWHAALNTYNQKREAGESLADSMKRNSSAYRMKSKEYIKAKNEDFNPVEQQVKTKMLNSILNFQPDPNWKYQFHENPRFYKNDDEMVKVLKKKWGNNVDFDNRKKIGTEYYFPMKENKRLDLSELNPLKVTEAQADELPIDLEAGNPFSGVTQAQDSIQGQGANPFAAINAEPEIKQPSGQEIALTPEQQSSQMAALQKSKGITRDVLGEFATQHPLFPVFAVTMPVFEASYQVLSRLPRFSQSEMGKKIIDSIPEESAVDLASVVPLPFFKTVTGTEAKVPAKQAALIAMDAVQQLGTLLAAGKIEEGVSRALVNNSVSILGGKLMDAGHGEAQVVIPQETLDKVGKYTPSGEAILANLNARKLKIEARPPAMGMPQSTPEEVVKVMDTLKPISPMPASKAVTEPIVEQVSAGPKTLLSWTLKSGRVKTSALSEYLGKEWKQQLPFSVAKNEGRDPSELYQEAVDGGLIAPMPADYTGGEGQYFIDQLKTQKNKILETHKTFEDQFDKEFAAFQEREKVNVEPIETKEIAGMQDDIAKEVNSLSDEEVVNEYLSQNPTFKTPQEANAYIDDVIKQGGQAEIIRVSPDEVEVSSTMPAPPKQETNPFEAISVQPTMPPKPLQPQVPQSELPILTELKYGLSPQVQKTIFDNAQDAEAKLKLSEKAGRVLLPGSQQQEPIDNAKLRSVLNAGHKKIGFPGANLLNWLKDAAVSIFEGVKLEYEPTIREFPQLQDDLRTGPVTFSRKAREQAELAVGGVIGNLNNYQEELFFNIVGMKDLVARGGEGITLPQDIKVDDIVAELAKQLKIAPQVVLDAVLKYDTLMKDIGYDLVAREKLGIDELKTNYFPHYVLDYMPSWWDESSAYLPKRLRKPYGAYLKKAVGSTKDIAITKEALAWHLSSVFMDNAIDDWAIEQLTKYDKVGMTPEQLDSVGPVKPNEIVNVGTKRYRGFQYAPGRQVFPAQLTNPSAINKAIENNLSVQDWAKSLPQGVAMGRYNKVYLLPVEVYDRFSKLKSPWGDNPFLQLAMPATAQWKRITLDWAGLPFQAANLFGDFINLFRTAPGATEEITPALNILKNLRSTDKLTPWQQKVLKIAHEKDVLGAGFVQEYAHITPFLTPQGILEKLERFSSLREGLLRMAMLSYQMKRGEVGMQFVAPEFSQYIAKLDKDSAAAYIARNFTVDYLAIPEWYRRWIRGFAAPFITFYHINAKNWAKYVKGSPLGFIIKFLAPIVGIWAYNNTGDRKKVEERLPDYWRWRPFHVILKSEDLNHDGTPDRALIWGPQTPIEMAFSMVGMDKVGDKLTMIRAKRMTIKEAATQQLIDVGLGAASTAHSLLNPMIQFFEGILSNRDPRTKQEVVPSELANVSATAKLPYQTRYFFEKMLAPYGQYLKEAKGTKPESWGILTGPLDISRAFGFYTVNLGSTDAKIEMDQNRKLRGDYDTLMYKIERRYLDGRDYSDIQREAQAQGINISDRSIYDRIATTRVQLEKVKEDMRNAKDPLVRRRLEIEYDNLIKQRADESIKLVPKGARK